MSRVAHESRNLARLPLAPVIHLRCNHADGSASSATPFRRCRARCSAAASPAQNGLPEPRRPGSRHRLRDGVAPPPVLGVPSATDMSRSLRALFSRPRPPGCRPWMGSRVARSTRAGGRRPGRARGYNRGCRYRRRSRSSSARRALLSWLVLCWLLSPSTLMKAVKIYQFS